MARLTPIERAIAGEPADRRRRYDEKMRQKGFARVTAMVLPEDAELVKALAKRLRDDPAIRPAFRRIVEAAAKSSTERPERPQRSEDAPRARRPRERS